MDGPFVFFCTSRLSAEKNHALLLAAFADAFAGDPTTRLHLAGDGPIEAELRRLCREQGVEGQVEFLGNLAAERLRAAMARADAFALASNGETFGVVVIEALAAGLPVVSTASGGPDHLIDASNGLLVPTRDRSALRDALIEMRRRAASYDRAQIRADALRRFGPAAFVSRFEEIVEAAAAPHPGPLPARGERESGGEAGDNVANSERRRSRVPSPRNAGKGTG